MQETPVRFLGQEDRLPTAVFMGFSGGSDGNESACSAGDLGLIPGLGRFPGEGNGYSLQYSGLVNFMDHIIYGVTKSQTRLETCTFTFIGRTDAEAEAPVLWPPDMNR